MEIKNTYGIVIWKDELPTVKESVVAAIKSSANLRSADLSSADLRSANLRFANLRFANVSSANLRSADLSSADLSFANLRSADLRSANLSSADLSSANVSSANLRSIPIVAHIDAVILASIEAGGKLQMDKWHKCGTTHCRGGWAVIHAGEDGQKLENAFGSETAASLIYAVSRPTQGVPDFFASNDAAMDDIRKCAALDPIPTTQAK